MAEPSRMELVGKRWITSLIVLVVGVAAVALPAVFPTMTADTSIFGVGGDIVWTTIAGPIVLVVLLFSHIGRRHHRRSRSGAERD